MPRYSSREISDEIVAFDPESLARLPVRKADALASVSDAPRARRVVAAIPERDGLLDPEAVDRLLIRVHCEMQRISEEFQHGQRVAELLRPLLAALREGAAPRPLRVVDVGCGTGYVVRWLAARGGLGEDVELVGADYNAALVGEAERLARLEGLRCGFVTANAFALRAPASVFLTTGVLHHFRGDALRRFFESHERPTAQAFAHFDFQPTPWAGLGAWLFHAIRMREPLARHDGVVSAQRAHPAATLLAAAKQGAPGFLRGIYGARLAPLPVPRTFYSLVGIRPALREAFLAALGRRRPRLGELA